MTWLPPHNVDSVKSGAALCQDHTNRGIVPINSCSEVVGRLSYSSIVVALFARLLGAYSVLYVGGSVSMLRAILRLLPSSSFVVVMTVASVSGPASVQAAYTFSKIVDTATTAPDTALLFTGFSRVAYDGENIALIGTSGAGNTPGIYQWNDSQLNEVVSSGDAVPSAGTTFSNFANLALSNGFVAFQGTGGAVEGVYTNVGGTLRRVADTTTVMPGTTAIFSSLFGTGTPSFDVALDGSDVYFSGFGTDGFVFDEGVYRESGGSLSVVANRSTVFPGETEPFTFFRGELDADGGHVVLEPGGLFTTHGAAVGSFRKVFGRDSTLPGLTPPLVIFSPNTYSIDDGITAFIASDGDTYDSYLYIQQPNGVNRRVVDETEINPVTNNWEFANR